MVDGRRWTTPTDRRRLVGYTIGSSCEPKGSGELKIADAFLFGFLSPCKIMAL